MIVYILFKWSDLNDHRTYGGSFNLFKQFK